MGSIIKPKKPDTSAADKQAKLLAQQEADTKKQEEEQRLKDEAARRARTGGGRTSLLTGLETGVSAASDKRGTLG